jgi:hypothetical protein
MTNRRTIPTLTRGEAYDLIDELRDDLEALAALAAHWECSLDRVPMHEWELALAEFVDGASVTDDVRSNGPHDDDDTGLTAI